MTDVIYDLIRAYVHKICFVSDLKSDFFLTLKRSLHDESVGLFLQKRTFESVRKSQTS